MITDNQTNFVYLSESIRRKETEPYRTFLSNLIKIFNELDIKRGFLPDTKNIWARDFMPIQVDDNHYVQFDYNPDYLSEPNWQKTISDVDEICKQINIKTEKSSLKVDGGNVVRSSNRVIMCNKVFHENAHIPYKQVIEELESGLDVSEIIFLPWDRKNDKFGHADGMVRFLDDHTVFINNMDEKKDKYMKDQIRLILESAGLRCIELPYNPYKNHSSMKAIGIYINYLETDSGVIVPKYGGEQHADNDQKAMKVLQESFHGKKVIDIDANVIAKEGGILNCITWNIKKTC